MTSSNAAEPQPSVTSLVESALRDLIEDLDYDMHKSLECHEEDGSDSYPALAEEFMEKLQPAFDCHAHELAEKIRADVEATGDWTCCKQARLDAARSIDSAHDEKE